MTRRALLAFIAVLLLPSILGAFAPQARAGGSDPQIVLDEIYGQVDAMCGGDGQGAAYDIYAIAKTYFAPDLAKPFEKAMEAGDLDFDILVDGQDCKISDLELAVTESTDASATGRATFKNMGEARVIDFLMTKTGAAWKVSDVVYRHRSFSLRSAL
ncbi:hypothetical protein [uncultured Hyphomicrobium sp.]|uniref:hypothetical protein n=1 Tax=uncultured Hyphomicrobium sp. TaxID=194373 RepID=UPI0025D092AB|nr:hypothetical protein [uncultured Hyphomicrobium sp.]